MRLPCLALLFFSGCATTVSVDGFKLAQRDWTEAQSAIRARASFDLSCPADELSLQVLAKFPEHAIANQIGVTGCEKKAVYVLTASGWVSNTSRQK